MGLFSAQSIILLTLWTVCASVAVATSMFDIWSDWRGWLIPGSIPFLPMMWFSLQWDLAHYFVPDLAPDRWNFHSTSGFFLGVFVGGCLGVGTGMFALEMTTHSGNIGQTDLLLWMAAGFGLLVGFAILGWRQAQALDSHLNGALLWVGAMAIAWVPMLLIWLGYEAFVRGMDINIYPEAHTNVQFLAAEAALFCPSLAIFALIVRRSKIARTGKTLQVVPPPFNPTQRLLGPLTVLLLPLLVTVLGFGGLWLGKAIRIERAWVAEGSAGYLSIDANGNVNTLPPIREGWDPSSKLRDSLTDGTKIAVVVGSQIVISATNGTEGAVGPQLARTTIRTIEVFSGPPPADYYAPDIINMIRFSPDGTMLAAGTGQAIEFDSAVNPSKDHSVHVWAVSEGTERYNLTEPIMTVRALAWSPDGRFIAASGGIENKFDFFESDNLIRVWQLDTRSNEASSSSLVFTLVGHKTTVDALAWSPDSSKLISRDQRGLVVIWRIP